MVLFMLLGVSSCFLLFSFPRKVLILLMMECIFLCCFFLFFSHFVISGSGLIFFFFLLMVFFVLDSVFGVTLLLSLGRSQGFHSSMFL